jgi:hypothetical protein
MKQDWGWKSKANWKDRNWEYTPASQTDVSKTIARVRKEMKKLAEQQPSQVIKLKQVAR